MVQVLAWRLTRAPLKLELSTAIPVGLSERNGQASPAIRKLYGWPQAFVGAG